MFSGSRGFILGGLTVFLIAAPCLTVHGADVAPAYTAQGIVNTATQTAGPLAPNAIVTLYGTNLAFSTASATGLLPGAVLPNNLAGVTVFVNGMTASLFYVSPGQINFLIPYEQVAGTAIITVARQALAGPSIKVPLNSTSPGLFPLPAADGSGSNAIASHLSGALISPGAPAKAGEIVVLYVAGLGRVRPDTESGRLVTSAAPILAAAQLQVLLAGVPVPSANVLYAGLAPGFAGLYQINLRLPDALPANPEIQIAISGQTSQAGIRLPTAESAPPVDSQNPN
jgi:uncharacterized protein (TIGR03437 family)